MPDVDIKDQLKQIVKIQSIDGEIFNLKKDLKLKPALIQELADTFESSKSQLKALEQELTAIQLARKDNELELKTKEDAITKANTQLSQIKTNKELIW